VDWNDLTTQGRHPHRKWIVFAVIVATALTVATYVLVLNSFNSAARAARPFVTGVNTTDAIDVKAKVVSVDPGKNDMTLRLEFFPSGKYANNGGALTQSMDLLINGTTSNSTLSFPVGTFMSPTNVTLALDGKVNSYPFDKYRVEFDIFFYPHDAQAANQKLVIAYTQLSTSAAVHGYSIGLTDVSLRRHQPGFNTIVFDVRRAGSTLFFTIFVMVFMWSLALAGLAMGLMMLLLRRDIGPGPLGYLAALLFAFPAIRNSLPDSPGIGTKFDFLAFFWAEAVVAITLVALAILWIVREIRSDGQSAETKAINELAHDLETLGLKPSKPHE
jgi:hypothetical protein